MLQTLKTFASPKSVTFMYCIMLFLRLSLCQQSMILLNLKNKCMLSSISSWHNTQLVVQLIHGSCSCRETITTNSPNNFFLTFAGNLTFHISCELPADQSCSIFKTLSIVSIKKKGPVGLG
jgi:hypothetical protein